MKKIILSFLALMILVSVTGGIVVYIFIYRKMFELRLFQYFSAEKSSEKPIFLSIQNSTQNASF